MRVALLFLACLALACAKTKFAVHNAVFFEGEAVSLPSNGQAIYQINYPSSYVGSSASVQAAAALPTTVIDVVVAQTYQTNTPSATQYDYDTLQIVPGTSTLYVTITTTDADRITWHLNFIRPAYLQPGLTYNVTSPDFTQSANSYIVRQLTFSASNTLNDLLITPADPHYNGFAFSTLEDGYIDTPFKGPVTFYVTDNSKQWQSLTVRDDTLQTLVVALSQPQLYYRVSITGSALGVKITGPVGFLSRAQYQTGDYYVRLPPNGTYTFQGLVALSVPVLGQEFSAKPSTNYTINLPAVVFNSSNVGTLILKSGSSSIINNFPSNYAMVYQQTSTKTVNDGQTITADQSTLYSVTVPNDYAGFYLDLKNGAKVYGPTKYTSSQIAIFPGAGTIYFVLVGGDATVRLSRALNVDFNVSTAFTQPFFTAKLPSGNYYQVSAKPTNNGAPQTYFPYYSSGSTVSGIYTGFSANNPTNFTLLYVPSINMAQSTQIPVKGSLLAQLNAPVNTRFVQVDATSSATVTFNQVETFTLQNGKNLLYAPSLVGGGSVAVFQSNDQNNIAVSFPDYSDDTPGDYAYAVTNYNKFSVQLNIASSQFTAGTFNAYIAQIANISINRVQVLSTTGSSPVKIIFVITEDLTPGQTTNAIAVNNLSGSKNVLVSTGSFSQISSGNAGQPVESTYSTYTQQQVTGEIGSASTMICGMLVVVLLALF